MPVSDRQTKKGAENTCLVRLYVAVELRYRAIAANPELAGDVSDEALVVGNDDDASVPVAERLHERVETLSHNHQRQRGYGKGDCEKV